MVIDIPTTSACNYGCTYCSEGLYSKEELKARIPNTKTKVSISSIQLLISQIRSERPQEKITFGMWGGEPLLNWDFCKDLMNAFADDKNIVFLYYTNGFYIKRLLGEFKEFLERLGRDRLLMQVSYDGRAINDRTRLTKGGRSTSNTAVKAFKLLKDNGFNVKFKSTLPIEHADKMYECFKEFVDMGEPYFPTPDIAHWYDQTQIDVYAQELCSSLTKIAQHIYKHNLDPKVFKWFTPQKARCMAGCDYIAIDIDGMVVPCHGAMYEGEEHRWGNILEVDIWKKIKAKFAVYQQMRDTLYKSDSCRKCSALYCMSCPAHTHALVKNGTYEERWTAVNPNTCLVFKISDVVHKNLLRASSI